MKNYEAPSIEVVELVSENICDTSALGNNQGSWTSQGIFNSDSWSSELYESGFYQE